MTTVARGFWTSAPVPVASAIGTKPSEATSAVMTTGRKRVSAPIDTLCSTVIRYRAKGALRDVGKALGLTEDLIKMLSSQVWGWSEEGVEAWRTVLADLINRGLRRPEFLIVDGAPGLDKAIASVWDGVPVQRCSVHKHRTCSPTPPSGCMTRSLRITTT